MLIFLIYCANQINEMIARRHEAPLLPNSSEEQKYSFGSEVVEDDLSETESEVKIGLEKEEPHEELQTLLRKLSSRRRKAFSEEANTPPVIFGVPLFQAESELPNFHRLKPTKQSTYSQNSTP